MIHQAELHLTKERSLYRKALDDAKEYTPVLLFWQTFLYEHTNIKSFHHLSFPSSDKGHVSAGVKSDAPEVYFNLLKDEWTTILQERLTPTGVFPSRQWYLYEKMSLVQKVRGISPAPSLVCQTLQRSLPQLLQSPVPSPPVPAPLAFSTTTATSTTTTPTIITTPEYPSVPPSKRPRCCGIRKGTMLVLAQLRCSYLYSCVSLSLRILPCLCRL